MAKRTIQVKFWRHRNTAGKIRIGWHGEEVDLPKDEIARGEEAGVFKSTPVSATISQELLDQMSDVTSHIRLPDGHEASDDASQGAVLHHDTDQLTPPELAATGVVVRADGQDMPADAQPIAPPIITEPIGPDPAATLTTTDPASISTQPSSNVERPARAATKAVWVDYVVAATASKGDEAITREQAEGMSKDDLQAVEV